LGQADVDAATMAIDIQNGLAGSGLDLVAATRAMLDFMEEVDEEAEILFQPDFLRCAWYRWENIM